MFICNIPVNANVQAGLEFDKDEDQLEPLYFYNWWKKRFYDVNDIQFKMPGFSHF